MVKKTVLTISTQTRMSGDNTLCTVNNRIAEFLRIGLVRYKQKNAPPTVHKKPLLPALASRIEIRTKNAANIWQSLTLVGGAEVITNVCFTMIF